MEYYSTKQIATLLQVKTITIRRWIAKGVLQAYRIGRDMRVKKEDLDKFIEERKVNV